MRRLTKKGATGVLHIYSTKEAANLFFAEGNIVAAAKGLVEGEEVVKQILDWSGARFSWQPELRAPSSLKPLDLCFPEYLARLRLVPMLESNSLPEAPAPAPMPMPMPMPMTMPAPVSAPSPEPAPVFISIASRAASTGPLLVPRIAEPAARPLVDKSASQLIPVPTALTATKNLSGAMGGDTFEKALMRKHQLALVSVDDTQAPRLRIIRSSNLVGRNPACDFTMNHSSISRQHSLLQITERGLHVKDLSTTNGTKVNGINLTEGYVSVGDMLTFGALNFMVEKDEPVGA